MNIKNINICREAWRLYDVWQDALDDRPIDIDDVLAAHKAYSEHRRTCTECTPHAEKHENDTDKS